MEKEWWVVGLSAGVNHKTTHHRKTRAYSLKKKSVKALADELPAPTTGLPRINATVSEVLFLAAGLGTSITDACEERGGIHADTVARYLTALDYRGAEARLGRANDAILGLARKEGVLPEECWIAIDRTVAPDDSEKHVGAMGYGDLPGTDYGLAYISTESLRAPARFTFAFAPVRPGANREKIIEAQLEKTLQWTRVTRALLDRGFACAYVYLLFLKRGIRFVIPKPVDDRVAELREEAWRKRESIPGTPYSCHVVSEYTVTESRGERRQATVQLVFFFEPDPIVPRHSIGVYS